MTELHDDLDAYVMSDDELEAAARASDGDEPVEVPPDADKANGLLRAMRGIDRELRRIDMLAEQEISRISSWRNDRSFGLHRRRAAIETALEQWMRAVNRVTPKRKSEALPNGTVKLRAPQRSVVVTSPGDFLVWWRENTRMEVAKFLREQLDRDDMNLDEITAEVVELVLSRSPLVKCQPEPSKSGIKSTGAEGAALDSTDEGVRLTAVVVDGEAVPGVAFAMPVEDTFSVTV